VVDTHFLKWGERTAKPSVWNAIWVISSFMKWMIATGRRKFANPVVTSYHTRMKAKRLPRPYTEEKMNQIWSLLDLRGTTVVRLAVAIAEETGLRRDELANLRLTDIDLKQQRLFVRLPNKTMVEAWAPTVTWFPAQTIRSLIVWTKNLGRGGLQSNKTQRPRNRPWTQDLKPLLKLFI
jgi:integrase